MLLHDEVLAGSTLRLFPTDSVDKPGRSAKHDDEHKTACRKPEDPSGSPAYQCPRWRRQTHATRHRCSDTAWHPCPNRTIRRLGRRDPGCTHVQRVPPGFLERTGDSPRVGQRQRRHHACARPVLPGASAVGSFGTVSQTLRNQLHSRREIRFRRRVRGARPIIARFQWTNPCPSKRLGQQPVKPKRPKKWTWVRATFTSRRSTLGFSDVSLF